MKGRHGVRHSKRPPTAPGPRLSAARDQRPLAESRPSLLAVPRSSSLATARLSLLAALRLSLVGVSRRRRLAAPLLLLVAVVAAGLIGGCGVGASPAAPSALNVAGVVTSASLPKSVPLSIEIPKIGVQSTLLSLGLTRHRTVQLPPPSTPMQAGWFDGGPTPGEIGPATIFGHMDGDHQEGIFFRLDELAPGDLVLIKRQDGSTATFRVTHVQELSKGSFPTDAVHGATTDAELRLVTCGSTFDPATHGYRDNIIVFATLVANPG
jgi:sortase (surface protein transpeptidase)